MTDDYDRGHRAAYAAMAAHIAEQIGPGAKRDIGPDTAQQKASELARHWLQPRLNMINRLRHPEGLAPEQLIRARAVGRAWRSATQQLCEAFSVPEPQPDPTDPSADHARALLASEVDLLGLAAAMGRPAYADTGALAGHVAPMNGEGIGIRLDDLGITPEQLAAMAPPPPVGPWRDLSMAALFHRDAFIDRSTLRDPEPSDRLRAAVREAAGPAKVGGAYAEAMGALEAHDERDAAAPDREQLGRETYDVWAEIARSLFCVEPSPGGWDALPERNREMNRIVGERLFNLGAKHGFAEGAAHAVKACRADAAWQKATGVTWPGEAAQKIAAISAAVERLEQSAVEREAKLTEMAAELERVRAQLTGVRPPLPVASLVDAVLDVVTDHLDLPGARAPRLRADLLRRLRGELANGVAPDPGSHPITGDVVALAEQIRKLLASVYDQPADGELRHGRTARAVLKVVEEWRFARARTDVPAKPADVSLGQRWTCTGIDGVLVVVELAGETAVGLAPVGSVDICVRVRKSDMLGLKEWSFVGA